MQQAGATLHRGARASHYRGLSCCRAQAPDTQAQVIVAHGPSCSVACGIFPDQGLNPCPLHWQADSQPLCHQEAHHSHSYINNVSSRSLPILLVFSNNQLLISLIFSTIFSITLFSTLFFITSFLLLTMGLICSFFSRFLR